MLLHAAHETSLETVRESPIITPYGKEFGKHKGDFGVVAEIDGLPVGAGWFRLLKDKGGFAVIADKDIPELALAVLPDHQGQGIGAKLLHRLIEEAQKETRQLRGVCLTCRTNNNAALHLYKKFGFVQVPNSEEVNRTGGTSMTMIRMLTPDTGKKQYR